jgi:hypothetical protein
MSHLRQPADVSRNLGMMVVVIEVITEVDGRIHSWLDGRPVTTATIPGMGFSSPLSQIAPVTIQGKN